ncbi:GNAT family N-acetyltransferase [Mucilaginibacter ginsenosidivorax]|uniref:GNAT family N-acetyltransferase n=2 Tax=Mucilaginibacter ginsenosidivorax TaxID=862126 RepID=A0A5B8W0H2_9SPHI|nr:GNAT family N-acetyltransferase [Mucilaginibacter ginsenosidivorax]
MPKSSMRWTTSGYPIPSPTPINTYGIPIGSWCIKPQNTSIGGMGFAGYPNDSGEAEIGYMIDGNQHNKGFATEAIQAMIKWAFTHPFVKAIIVHTYADNLPSRRLMDKCGFEQVEEIEGLLTYRLNRKTLI